jgi:ribonuclease BN (tRNA processing enzyme)
VDAIPITQGYPDHCIDLRGLFRTRFYGGWGSPRIPLYCPPGALEPLQGLEPDADLAAVFDVHSLPGLTVRTRSN